MQKFKRQLQLVCCESAVTAGILSISIMTPFYLSIGLNQQEIALSQAAFTVVVALLNIPTGWIADRFSRKLANIIGDFGVAIGLLFYANAQNFWAVVACESALGVFSAFSQGVDNSLLRHFANRYRPNDQSFFKRQTSKLAFWQTSCSLVLVLLGGPIGAISFRLAIALSGVPFLIGGIISLFIHDDSERLAPTHQNPLRDMARLGRATLQNPPLRHRIFAFAVSRELTHVLIWTLTPLLLAAGVPLSIVSVAWAINQVANIVGTRLAVHFAHRLKDWQVVAVALALMTVCFGALSWQINLFTICFYLLSGITQGWTAATMPAIVQEHGPASAQTSVLSIAKVAAQILYIPSVWLVGAAADVSLRLAPLTALAIFLPLGIISIILLKRE